MRLPLIIWLIPVTVMVVACDATLKTYPEEITSIDLTRGVSDTSEWNLSETVDDLTLVKLGRETSIILGKIHDINMFSSGFVVTTDVGTFLFDKQGNYDHILYRIGRGPGEFISGRIMCFISDTAVIIDDASKSREYYYTVGISSGFVGKIKKATSGRTNSLIVWNDSILVGLLDEMKPGRDNFLRYSLVLQDIEGNILDEYGLGYDMGNILGMGTLILKEEGIIASLPTGELLLNLFDSVIDTLWKNKGLKKVASPILPGIYEQIAFGNLSQTKVFLLNRTLIVKHKSQTFTEWGIILVDRKTGYAEVLKPYLFSENMQLDLSRDDFTRDGFICKVLYPSFLQRIDSLHGGHDFLNSLRKTCDPQLERITLDDNPYLLFGRIR
jgi:hypothetical protein